MKMIVSSDWHLRNDLPRCRVDENWIETQRNTLSQIADICIKKNADLWIIGDLFHRWNEYTMVRLVQQLAEILEKNKLKIYYLSGNHDLKHRSTDNSDISAIGLLKGSRNIFNLSNIENVSAGDFGTEIKENEIMCIHTLVLKDDDDKLKYIDNCITASGLLNKYKKCKWLFTGDNHQCFTKTINGRTLINPGCILRQASDNKDFECSVFYVDTEEDEFVRYKLKDAYDLVDDRYIEIQHERENELESFAKKIENTDIKSFDFREVIKERLNESDTVDKAVKDKILELIGE